jgi:hypothetical protein
MPHVDQQAHARNSVHRDSPIICSSCGRQTRRRMRGQRYCSKRCRQQAHREKSAAEGFISGRRYHPSGHATTPLKKGSNLNALQGVKTQSSHCILAPAHVLAAEVIETRECRSAISSSGAVLEIGRLRPRALARSA